ncbi:MAG: competence protein ComEC, partial [Gammaproteobacteria bacterium]|nr:competence protein ComEC [Gammaproteobacteria bacterium]
TPEAVEESALDSALSSIFRAVKAATVYIKSLWGEEYFPPEPTSRENEMSVVQSAVLNGHRVMLTGDAGREALQEVIDYAPIAGLALPGIRYFQVPHHGGRHNVSTEILDQLVGSRLDSMPDTHTWNAICSSAKADEDHPRKSVIRAVLHRGGHWAATGSKSLRIGAGITRDGWVSIPQAEYPEAQES